MMKIRSDKSFSYRYVFIVYKVLYYIFVTSNMSKDKIVILIKTNHKISKFYYRYFFL